MHVLFIDLYLCVYVNWPYLMILIFLSILLTKKKKKIWLCLVYPFSQKISGFSE